MLALTNAQWNWILTGAAIFVLAMILTASAVLGRRDTREAEKRSRRPGALPPGKHEDEETRKAA